MTDHNKKKSSIVSEYLKQAGSDILGCHYADIVERLSKSTVFLTEPTEESRKASEDLRKKYSVGDVKP